MAKATLTSAQINTLVLARTHSSKDVRQSIKKEIFAAAKEKFGIPSEMAIKTITRVTLATESAADVGVIKNKAGETFDLAADGLWVGAVREANGTNVDLVKWVYLDPATVAGAVRDVIDHVLTIDEVSVFDDKASADAKVAADGGYVMQMTASDIEDTLG